MEETDYYDLIIRVPHPPAEDYDDQLVIQAGIVNRLRLAFARTPVAGVVIAEPTTDYLEHVLAGTPGDAPLTALFTAP